MTKTTPKPRSFKPRTPIIVAPFSLSQITSEATIGVNDGRYLEACRTYPKLLRPVKVGRLVVTKIDAWETLLAHLAETGADLPDAPPANDPADEQRDEQRDEPASAESVLARLGLKLKAVSR